MTTAHAEPVAGDHAHDDDPAHAFDGEPIKTLPEDEPRTPGWLPVLGLVLFVGAGIAMLVTGSEAPAGDAAPAKTTEAAAPPPAATPTPAPQAAGSAVPQLGPDQMRQLQQLIQQAQARGGLPGLGSAAPSAAAPSAAAPPARGPAKAPVKAAPRGPAH